ncbi:MAG: EAL domain-containing protein, partial [Gammaproteobacteria bacterium]|nr:EAL domain-containing protein [Gammaproteobacteria bacterium]
MLGVVLRHMQSISEKQDNFENQEASKELKLALVNLERHVENVRKNINDWGETKQQFVNREFYQIWREMRVSDSGILPSEFDDLALYDDNGKIFGAPGRHKPMPLSINKGQPYLQKLVSGQDEDKFEYWLYVFPIFGVDLTGLYESKKVVLGYAGVLFSIKNMFVRVGDFNFIDINSVATIYQDKTIFDFTNLNEYLRYEIKSDTYRKELISATNTALVNISLFVTFAMLAALFFIHQFLVRPLKNISVEIDELYNNNSSSEVSSLSLPHQSILELENVRSSFNDYQSRLVSLNKDLELNNKEFFRIAHEDSLTGAFNRRAFEDDWSEYNQYKKDELYAVLIFDCDNFKPINDSYGHAVGDAVIRNVASVLMKSIGSTEKLYRLGGDEFSTLLKRTSQKEAIALAELCRENILAHDFRKYGLSESISVSVGISFSKVGENTFTDVMKRADLAMYKAKRPAESSIVIYTEDLSTVESITSTNTVNAVFAAIKYPDKIKMRYQPVVKLPSLDTSYVEALVKIQHEDQTYMPDVIFPVVEGRNLDVEFDLSIILAIEKDLESENFSVDQGVSINLSAPSVINTRVTDLLIKIKISHPKIKFIIEITETALITQIERASKNINQLRDSGYLIALDDFGSGYSSLRYLTSMPVDIIKFDISMIHLLESENEEHRNMIEKIAELIIELGYDVVAEGVET